MQKAAFAGVLFFAVVIQSVAQKTKRSVQKQIGDSLVKQDPFVSGPEKVITIENLPIVSLDESEINSKPFQNIASSVTATSDPFLSQASFNFSPVRFRFRGYDADHNIMYINGIPLENIENGFALSSLVYGLSNDVVRNREVSIGLQNNSFSFGGIGISTQIDNKPEKQRKQNSFSYAFADGIYTHKMSFTHASGINKKGWSFVFSGSRRWADEGYVPGTYSNAWNGFAGLGKKIGLKIIYRLLHLQIFLKTEDRALLLQKWILWRVLIIIILSGAIKTEREEMPMLQKQINLILFSRMNIK